MTDEGRFRPMNPKFSTGIFQSFGSLLRFARELMRIDAGLKARNVIAWAEASTASAGPGQPHKHH